MWHTADYRNTVLLSVVFPQPPGDERLGARGKALVPLMPIAPRPLPPARRKAVTIPQPAASCHSQTEQANVSAEMLEVRRREKPEPTQAQR